MKFLTFGATFFTCQLPQINCGLVNLGHQIEEKYPDVIYSNDIGGYERAIKAKLVNPKAKLILNVLDIPEHLENVASVVAQYKTLLAQADIVTCISAFVQTQVLKHTGILASVIYNPIQNIQYQAAIQPKSIPFIYVGRAEDANKRYYLSTQTAAKFNEVTTLVSSYPNHHYGACRFKGQIPVNELEELYSQSKYMVFMSKIEGLGLPPIEAFIKGCLPILSSDNLTAREFFDERFICEPNVTAIVNKVIELENNYQNIQSDIIGKRYDLWKKLNGTAIAQNIVDLVK